MQHYIQQRNFFILLNFQSLLNYTAMPVLQEIKHVIQAIIRIAYVTSNTATEIIQ